MARYSSDSEDDRRTRERRSKSSRKRDRRSRSRSRGRRRRSGSRSRSSRSHRRRSRSRSFDRRSSDHESYRSRRSRSDRDRRSRSPSSSRNSEDGQREKRERDGAVEKTKQRIKEALNQAETKDDDLIRAKEKKKIGKEVIPSSDAIAEIESDAFVQQSFSSSGKDKQATTVDDSQPGVLFGSTRVSATVPTVNVLTDSIEGKGLFAARVLEDESTKMERWIKKLTATRNKMLAAGSVKH